VSATTNSKNSREQSAAAAAAATMLGVGDNRDFNAFVRCPTHPPPHTEEERGGGGGSGDGLSLIDLTCRLAVRLPGNHLRGHPSIAREISCVNAICYAQPKKQTRQGTKNYTDQSRVEGRIAEHCKERQRGVVRCGAVRCGEVLPQSGGRRAGKVPVA